MTTVVVKKCPECGARFQLDVNEDRAKCSYCGTVSQIVSKKQPPRNVDRSRPVIYVSSGRSWVWTLVVFGIVMVAGPMTFMIQRLARSSGNGARVGQSFGESMQWEGNRQPMLVDLSGDGVMDVVGWVTFLNTGDKNWEHLGAFDSVTGARLWTTGPIADTSQAYHCKAAVLGDKLVVSDPAGLVKSFSLTTGAPVWQVVMGERVDRYCGGPAGQIVAHLKDKRAVGVNMATGQMSILGKVDSNTPCPYLQTDKSKESPYFARGGGTWDENGILNPVLEGMSAEMVLKDRATGRTVALGSRSPGTRTPMAALFQITDAEKKTSTAFWMNSVTSLNPLAVDEGSPERGAISQGRLLVPYEMEDSKAGHHLSCLDVNTGRILWDVPIPKSDTGTIGGFTASPHHVFVAHWTYLDIFRLADGVHALTIGVRW